MKQYNRFNAYTADSKWELKLQEGVMKDFEYHPKSIEYKKPETRHKYTPDWVYKYIDYDYDKSGINFIVYIEAKGRFRSREEMQKYIWIKQSFNLDLEELVFLFQKPNLPVFGASKRKDGTRMSHSQWAEKHGFRFFTEETIGDLLK